MHWASIFLGGKRLLKHKRLRIPRKANAIILHVNHHPVWFHFCNDIYPPYPVCWNGAHRVFDQIFHQNTDQHRIEADGWQRLPYLEVELNRSR